MAEAPAAEMAAGGNAAEGYTLGPDDAPVTIVEWEATPDRAARTSPVR